MRPATALLVCIFASTPASAQRLFVGLEGSAPVTKSSDLSGFPNVTWTDHAAFDVSGAAATADGLLYICNGPFTTQLYGFPLSEAPEFLCTISVDIQGMGYGNGTLYGYSNFASPIGIYAINPTTGQTALVVDLSTSGYRFFGLDFNHDDGLLYGYTEYGTPTGLYSIDPATGTTAFITGPIPASNTQGRALAVGSGVVYLAATRGDDGIPLYAFDLQAGGPWVAFTQPYPQHHSTGGAAWVHTSAIGVGNQIDGAELAPRIDSVAPNPVQARALVSWRVRSHGPVTIDLFDIAGRRVRTLVSGMFEGGVHVTAWNGVDASGRAVPSGVYYARLTANGSSSSRRILVVR